MAALTRPTQATYTISEEIVVDTSDNEDHTFCGIMFPVKCKDLLPLDHLVIRSVAVRGSLGPLTVWVSNEDQQQHNGENRVRLNPAFWTKLYDKTHKSSRHNYKELVLDMPIKIRPGQTKVIYIHSTLPSDEAIVYDNSYYGMSAKRYEDDKLAILTGRAHVSTQVFGQEPIWGWGNAWRDRREFVGRLEYGTVYKLWNPQVQPKFGGFFQDGSRCLFMCQRRWESPFSILPDECIFYILNMCRWDWFDDDSDTMKTRRKREKARAKAAALQIVNEETAAEAALAMDASESEDQIPAGREAMESEDEDGDFEMNEDDNSVEEADSNPDNEEGEEESDEDWSDEEEDHYHRANVQSFTYHDVDSDDEEEEERAEAAASSQRDWVRRQFARIHVLRALASMEDGGGGGYVEY